MLKKLLLFCSVFIICTVVVAQDFSNKGTDFWISYPVHINGTSSVMGIYITSDKNATGTIKVGTQTIPFTVTANTVVRKFLGSNASTVDASNAQVYLSTDDGVVKNAAIHISSDQPVVAYSHIIYQARSGATLLLPSDVWGRQYIAPSYYNLTNSAGAGYGTITVIAKDSNTVVQIKPTATSRNGKYPAGAYFTTPTLQPGDVYQVQFQQGADISGTLVESVAAGGNGCKKIAVFSSTSWSAFGCGGSASGDNLYQQLFPSGAWGKTFVTAPFKNRTSDIVRVFVSDPTTVVKKTENNITTTLTGLYNSFYEFTTGSATYITADKPVSVVQYVTTQACKAGCGNNNAPATCYADPEMIVINPVEQTINNITVFSAHRNFVPPGQSAVDQCFLNIIIKSNAAASFKINGSTPNGQFVTIPGTDYSYLQEDVTTSSISNPVQNLKADSNFIAIAYGFGSVESYGYNAGTNVIDLTQGLVLQNDYVTSNTPSACTNTQTNISAKFSYQPTSLTWDLGNDPNMSLSGTFGPYASPQPDSSFTDAISGKKIYVYKLPTKVSFAKTGTYNFTVTSNNPTSDGCSGIQQQNYSVTVFEKPLANFVYNHNGCLADTVIITDSSKGFGKDIKQWYWDFKDNTFTNVQNPKKIYGIAGTYNIGLRAVNELGCYADTTIAVTLTPKPQYALSAVTPACTGNNITITNNTSISFGTIVKWKWNYGNGQSDSTTTKQNGIQKYDSSGTYKVTLTTVSNSGCIDSSVTQIKSNPVPTAHFILPDVCLNDASADFTDSSYFKEQTNATLSYAWNFGDPSSNALNISSQQNPKHKYNATGVYNVSLTVTSSDGCTDAKTRNLTVNGAVPKADFQFVKTSKICSNEQVDIKNTSTVNFGDITRIEITWDINDPSSVPVVDELPVFNKIYSHSYTQFNSPASKTYTIRMRSFSGASCLNDVTKTITLYAMPKLSFSTIKGICNNATATVLTQASETAGNSGTFAYTGKGVTNANGNFDPAVAGTGVHVIKYTYTTDNACIDSIKSNIKVFVLPVASFTVKQPTCDKNTVVFNDASTSVDGNVKQWQWDFGNGKNEMNTTAVASQLYAQTGNYTVSLKVVSDSNCVSNADVKTLTVHPLPLVSFTVPSNVCLPSGKADFTNQTTIADGTQASLTYNWNFGDGNTSLMKDATNYYSSAGIKNIKLIAASNNGCKDSLSKNLDAVYPQPKSTSVSSSNEGCVDETFALQGNVQSSNGTAAQYHWNVNGINSSSINATANFTAAGNYTASFWFIDSKGCNSDTSKQILNVYNYPVLADMPTLYVLEGGSTKLQPQIQGSIIDLLWSPSLYLDSPKALTPTSTPLQNITYQLTATGQGNCAVSKNVTVQVLLSPTVPNTFSPNGDGVNDTWVIDHLSSYPDCTVEIFDRYGAIIFYSKGYTKAWNGTLNGKPLFAGTYYYVIDPKRGKQKITGSITILK